MPPKAIRVAIAGGGTGGHVVPALSIGEALRRRSPETELLFLGSDRGIEKDLIAKAGFPLKEFSLKGMPRNLSPSSLRAAWAMFGVYRQMRTLLAEFKPDVLVGTGGYVTVPAVLAATRMKIPVALQEQNSVPGRANRFLSRFASEIHIHFTESRRYFKDRGKLRLSGNPVRIKVPEGRAHRTLQKFRLHSDRKTVLILGGSQGAQSINTAFREMLPLFRGDRAVQFLILTGTEDYRTVLDAVRDSGVKVAVKSFHQEMEELYGVANLVVARAGAMTISEICTVGLASILIPYPHAMNDHQTVNAKALSDKDAAILLPDEKLSGKRLAQEIQKLLNDPRKIRDIALNAFSLHRHDAAARIAESVEALGGGAPVSILSVPEEYDEEVEEAKT